MFFGKRKSGVEMVQNRKIEKVGNSPTSPTPPTKAWMRCSGQVGELQVVAGNNPASLDDHKWVARELCQLSQRFHRSLRKFIFYHRAAKTCSRRRAPRAGSRSPKTELDKVLT
jgi:hypothetical protein